MMRRIPLALAAIVLTGQVLACRDGDAQSAHVAEVASAGGVVDSALSTGVRLERFRSTVGEHPDTLRHASPSIDHLVDRWARAVAARDTAALNAMVVDRAEFAWLYYPSARLALPPYEMPPALLWEQVLAQSDDGARRALSRFGGQVIGVRSFRCPAPPDSEGANVVRQGCVVRLRTGADTVPEGRYFGSILERGGRFKFLGLSNAL